MPVLATIGNDSLRPYGYAAGYPRDPYFSSVGGLFVVDGVTGSNNKTFLDSTGLNTITSTGTSNQQGTFSPFTKYTPYNPLRTGGSVYFNGVIGSYLSLPDRAGNEVGSGNFCLEFFIRPTSVTGTALLVGKRTAAAQFGPFVITRSTTSIQVSMSSNGTSNDVANAVTIGTVAANTWYHIALYRVGTAIYGAVDGTVTTVNGSTSATLINNASAIFIGSDSASQPYAGYMSSLRLVVGSSVYTSSNFTAPDLPLTAITNTQLLMNFTNAFIYDAALNTSLVTINSAAVSTSVTKWGGGSIALGPSIGNNYLQALLAPNMAMGAGDFTIDFWYYQPVSNLLYIFEVYSGNSGRLNIRSELNGTIRVSGNSLGQLAIGNATYPFTYAAWNHICVMRTSGDMGIYVNGRRTNAATAVTNNFTSTDGFAIGGLYATAQNGGSGGMYIEDLRATAGISRFTASTTLGAQAFTPPNGPAALT